MKTKPVPKGLDFLKILGPENTIEVLLFLACIAAYGTLAAVIALDYRIVFDNRIPWDAYFSFDNRSIVLTGGGAERHPLANYFFDALRSAGLAVSDGTFNSTFRIVIAEMSAFAVSLSVVQVYKYLRNIVVLPIKVCLLLIALFSCFSTNILLSFTPETYTYTLLALTTYNYFAAGKLKAEKKISLAGVTAATVIIGGLTITNILKVYLPLVFEREAFKRRNFLLILGRIALSLTVFLILYLNRLNFNIQTIIEKTGSQYERFSKPKVTPYWDMLSSWFFGGPLLFPSFVLRDYHNAKGFQYKAIFMDTYSEIYPYIFVGVIVALLLWSFVKNFRNPLFIILALSFGVDIIIHCVLKFGLHTAYIYGGHYIFLIPLFLGWLFSQYRSKPTVSKFLTGTVAILTVFLICNNVYRMQEFFTFLNLYYL